MVYKSARKTEQKDTRKFQTLLQLFEEINANIFSWNATELDIISERELFGFIF